MGHPHHFQTEKSRKFGACTVPAVVWGSPATHRRGERLQEDEGDRLGTLGPWKGWTKSRKTGDDGDMLVGQNFIDDDYETMM